MKFLNPSAWSRPSGYSNGVAASGRLVFVAGQIGWNAEQTFESDDLVDQTRQALENTVAVLAEANARPEHVARMTWYVKDKRPYLDRQQEIGQVYTDIFGRHYPAMSLVQVADLVEDRALVEIESTAVIPD